MTEVPSSVIRHPTSVGGVAQSGERLLCKQEVVGSIPITSTKRSWEHEITAAVAAVVFEIAAAVAAVVFEIAAAVAAAGFFDKVKRECDRGVVWRCWSWLMAESCRLRAAPRAAP